MTTWSTTDKGSNYTLSNGNLTVVNSGGGDQIARTTVGKAKLSGKTYWEYKVVGLGSPANIISGVSDSTTSVNTYLGNNTHSMGYISGGQIFLNGGYPVKTQPSYTVGDTIMIALDASQSPALIFFGLNGTFPDDTFNPATGRGGIALPDFVDFYPALSTNRNGAGLTLIPGPSTTYPPPTGYMAYDASGNMGMIPNGPASVSGAGSSKSPSAGYVTLAAAAVAASASTNVSSTAAVNAAPAIVTGGYVASAAGIAVVAVQPAAVAAAGSSTSSGAGVAVMLPVTIAALGSAPISGSAASNPAATIVTASGTSSAANIGYLSVVLSPAVAAGYASTAIGGAGAAAAQVSIVAAAASSQSPSSASIGPTDSIVRGAGQSVAQALASIATSAATIVARGVTFIAATAVITLRRVRILATGHADAARLPIYPAQSDIVYAEAQTRIVAVEPVVAIVPVNEERDMLQWPDKWQSEERVFGIDWAALTADAELVDLGASVLFGDIEIGNTRLVGTVHAVEVSGGSGPATVAFYVSTPTERRIEQRVEILVKG